MNRSILLVDDDSNVTNSLRRLFKGESVGVFTANSGARALEIVEKENIDLVITDQMMPGMNGAEFLEIALKIKPQLIPIMLSGYSNFDSLVHAVNQGHIVHFVSKPWDNGALKDLVFKELAGIRDKKLMAEDAELLNSLPGSWCLLTQEGQIVKCSNSFRVQADQNTENVIGSNFDSEFVINTGAEKVTDLIELSEKWGVWTGNIKINSRNGKPIPVSINVTRYKHKGEEKLYLIVLKEDRESEILKKELNKLVLVDLESGALNRSSFLKSAEAKINCLQREEKVIMAVIRIPKLEQLSLTLTAPIFQSICYKLISRIKTISTRPNLIGRISDDKFAVLSDAFSIASYQSSFIDELKDLFRQSFKISDRDIPIVPEIGFCSYPDEADSVTKMILSAVTASNLLVPNTKYQSKTEYIVESDFIVDHDVGEAIENRKFSFEYQPILDIKRNKLRGVECLLRWYEKGELVVNTEMLVNHIQRIGLSIKLDRLVMQSAITQLALWKSDGIETSMFINISPKSLCSKQFSSEIIAEILQSDVDPKCVSLEIIESSIIDVEEVFLSNVQELRDFGVRIFLDDFGTGFSNFETLKNIGVDGIKIDRGFIDGVDSDKTKRTITKCLFDLAGALNCELIAEGIEKRGQLNCLKSMGGSFFAQGYYLSRPFCASGIVSFLARWE